MDTGTKEFTDRFNSIEKLYHFTKFTRALDIIKSQSIKFSKMQNLNDINESYRPAYSNFTSDPKVENVELIEKEIRKYRQISLCIDSNIVNDKGQPEKKMAFTIEAMWGHYAEKGCGVCLVFDKPRLLANLDKDSWYDEIKYSDNHDNSIIIQGNTPKDIEDELYRNRKDYFFTKTKSWEYEQEVRIVKKCKSLSKDEFLEFGDSLLAVIMYSANNWSPKEHCSGSPQYKKLQAALSGKGIPVVCYSSFLGERSITYNDHKIFEQPLKD